jgi:DNA mismatch endonuclease (patch repair protein)
MADRVTPEQRSRMMSAIRGKDTAPEMAVRRLAHALGYRFRVHRKDLPGKPDLVFPGRKAVVFVHGCYWHGHGCARGGSGAKSNQAYWGPKITRNRERDVRNAAALEEAGWRVMTVWECEVKDRDALAARLREFLGEAGHLG